MSTEEQVLRQEVDAQLAKLKQANDALRGQIRELRRALLEAGTWRSIWKATALSSMGAFAVAMVVLVIAMH